MYRYDDFDSALVAQRVAQFRDQTRRFLAGELTEDEFRPLRLQNGLYVQKHAPMLRVAIPYGLLSSRSCACSRTSPASMTAVTAISPRARTSSSTGRGSRTCRRSSPNSRRSRCTRSRPAATACATRPATRSPASRPTRSSIRAPGASSSASGRRCIPNSRSCRASSRSPSPARRSTARRCWSTTSGRRRCATPAANVASGSFVGGGQGRTPMIGHVIREFLPAAELLNYFDAILRVYNLQAAATTSTRRGSRSW